MHLLKLTFLLSFLLTTPTYAGQQDNTKVEGQSSSIKWGEHWAGPKLKGTDILKDKVVLLVIWGG